MAFGGACAEVRAGATSAGATVTVIGFVVAAEPTPLVADTVKVELPGLVSEPDSRPELGSSARPAGRAPPAKAKVGFGFPVATKV